MDANSVAAFTAALNEHQLLQPAQLDEVARNPLSQGSDPRPLSKDLIERGWLTSYQVNQLLAGRGKDLLVGPYILLDRIGEGGMGQVFKARNRSTTQPVAVKLVRNQILANPNALKRFWQEVNLTAQLRHPNIVIALGAGQADKAHYFAMEYIEGIDLFRLVKESGPLPVGQAADYMRQAALGLQHALEKGLVHRDIKPANLMVTGGLLKVLDLGLARLQDQENGLTRIGAILGTPEFLSPEQTQNSRAVDIRSDLYSLGCTFFYVLAGREPFRAGSVPEILLKHHFDEPPPLAPLRTDVPAGVQAIIRKLMAKRPEDRYQTPAELAEALKPFCQTGGSAPSSARPNGTAAASGRSGKPGKMASVFALMRRRKANGKASATTGRRQQRSVRTKRPLLVLAVGVLLIALGMLFLENTFGISGWTKQTSGGDPSKDVAALTVSTAGNISSKPEPESKPEPRRDSRPESKPEPKPTTNPDTKPKPPPETKPEPKPVTRPEPKPEPKPASKKEVPDPARQAEAQKQVRASHEADFAKKKPGDQLTLAGRLLRQGLGPQDDPAVRFVLFREARDLAAQAGDVDASFRAIAEMDTWFTVDVREQKADALDVAAKATELSALIMKSVAEKALSQAEKAVDADDYDAATRMFVAADAAARKAGSTPLANRAQLRAKEVPEIRKEYALVKADAETLRVQPDSAEANFRWGRFLCLFKGKWSEGLPLLAKGNNAKWKALAVKELSEPSAAATHADLGDGWLAQGKQEPEQSLARRQLLLRAKHWFDRAAPKLTDVAKIRVERQLREIDQETGDGTTPTKPSSGRVFTTAQLYSKAMQAGDAALEKSKFGDAIGAYNEALNWMPKDAKALAGLHQARYGQYMAHGEALLAKKKFTEAAAEFGRALKEMPGDAEAQAALEKAQAGMK